jgi:hypothetical protein
VRLGGAVRAGGPPPRSRRSAPTRQPSRVAGGGTTPEGATLTISGLTTAGGSELPTLDAAPRIVSAVLARRNARRTRSSQAGQGGFRSAEAARNRPPEGGPRPAQRVICRRSSVTPTGPSELVTGSFRIRRATPPEGGSTRRSREPARAWRRPTERHSRSCGSRGVGRSHELSFPFSAISHGEPPDDGFASPASLPPQVFSTSRGFAPPATFRVCFTPVTLLGFVPFRGFPPLVAEHLSARRAPLDVCSRGNPPSGVLAASGSVLTPSDR